MFRFLLYLTDNKFLCFLIGGGFLFYGLHLFVKMIRLRMRCRTRVEARICEFTPVTRKQGKSYTTWYSPVYQYTVNQQEYRIKSVAELKEEKLPELGIYAVIYVDEENPECFIGREEDGEYSGDASSSAAIGISFFLLPYLGWFIVVPLVFAVQPLIEMVYKRLTGPLPE